MPLRIVRFIFFLLTLFFGVLLAHYGNDQDVTFYCRNRVRCEENCREDSFPGLTCDDVQDSIQLTFKGNTYNGFYFYPETIHSEFKECLDISKQYNSYPYDASDSSRMWKVHTCFHYCKNMTTDTILNGFTYDTRPACTSSSNNSLYCVKNSFPCETIKKPGDICFDSLNSRCLNFARICLGIFLANVMQLAFEAALLYSQEMIYLEKKNSSDDDKAKEIIRIASQSAEKGLLEEIYFCGSQVIYLGVFIAVCAMIFITLLYSITYGRPITVIIEFFLAVGFDQVKALITQPLIWYAFVRRLGSLDVVGWQEWSEQKIEEKGEIEALSEIIRNFLRAVLEHPITEYIILGSVILLSFFIFVELAMTDIVKGSSVYETISYDVYYVLSVMFLIEISLKIISYGKKYLLSCLNLLDTVVVLATSITLFTGATMNSLRYLRLLRLFRIVLEMKEIADEKKRIQELIKQNKRQTSKSLSPNIERIAEILEKIKEIKELPHLVKVGIDEKLNLIYSGKITAKKLRSEYLDLTRPEIETWVNLMKHESTPLLPPKHDTGKEGTESIPSILKGKGKKRASMYIVGQDTTGLQDLIDNNQMLYKLLDVPSHDQAMFEGALEKFDQWSFDAIIYHQMVGEQGFLLIALKVVSAHVSIKELGIPLRPLIDLLKEIYKTNQREGHPYHNAINVIDTLQALHFYLHVGNLKRYFSELDLFALIIACLICDYSHPGLTNKFLIRTKHPLALRYNDRSVLENYHCAAFFKLIKENDNVNIFRLLTKDIFGGLRKLIVDTVLGTDMSKHFDVLNGLKSALEGTINTKKYSDLVLIAQCCLKAAIYSKVARQQTQCSKWMDMMVEEFGKEGELEKNIGLPIGKFSERENVSQDRIALTYIDLICRPFLGTFLILAENEISSEIIEQGVEVNRKHIENKAEASK